MRGIRVRGVWGFKSGDFSFLPSHYLLSVPQKKNRPWCVSNEGARISKALGEISFRYSLLQRCAKSSERPFVQFCTIRSAEVSRIDSQSHETMEETRECDMDTVEKDDGTFAVSNRSVSRVTRNRGRFSFAIVCLRLKFDQRLRSGSRRQRHFDGRERRTGDPLGHLAIYQKWFLQFLHY